MQIFHKREIGLILFNVTAAGLFGSLFDKPALFIAISLGIYIVFMLRNIFKLHAWVLRHTENEIPEAHGFWGEIFLEIHHMQKENLRHRTRLRGMLTRFQEAAAALPDGMLVLTRHNKIEWANPAACCMLGVVYPDDVGQAINNLIRHPAFQEYLLANDFTKEIRLLSPENKEHTLTLQIIPYGSSQKLIICRNITHIIKLEAMRSQFVGNLSHELRSPITVLSGYLETLQNIKINSATDLKRPLFNMSDQVKRMERLVVDLLALSKLETEPVKFTNKIVDVPGLLSLIKESAELLSGDKQHLIRFDVEHDLLLRGDQDELRSLFTNLISNAVRYTPAKGKITVSWQRDHDEAVFLVQDTGPGIAQHHLVHLTRRFYRVDPDRSRETGGTGLGLAIVKHVLERHDSHLKIDSVLGQGSTFSCAFPTERVVTREPSSKNHHRQISG